MIHSWFWINLYFWIIVGYFPLLDCFELFFLELEGLSETIFIRLKEMSFMPLLLAVSSPWTGGLILSPHALVIWMNYLWFYFWGEILVILFCVLRICYMVAY